MNTDDGPPLTMERFRRAGLAVAVVLAPLLVVTLAQTILSRAVAIGIVICGVVALVVARARRG